MRPFLKSTFFAFLFLGFCFHTSHQRADIAKPATLLASFSPEQYTTYFNANSLQPKLLCMLDASMCEDSPAANFPNFSNDLEELPYSTYSQQYEPTEIPSETEKTALKIADILTVISRVIIALTGAIFGTRKALQKLNP